MPETETRIRYTDPQNYHDELRAGLTPEGEEVEVITIDTPNGERRIYADQAGEYAAVVAEMEAEDA